MMNYDKPINECDAPNFLQLFICNKSFKWFCFFIGFCIAVLIVNHYIEKPESISTIYGICFKNNTFQIEVARTREELSRGLMFRNHLDADKGMLFVFKGMGIRSFWMKNTLIPLDIVWLNENRTVVHIAENFQPCKTIECKTITPNANASMVLELNAGTAKKIGLTVGNRFALC